MLLAASYYTRIIVRRRLKPGAGGFSAQHVDYYDVDSLDYGFNTASKGVAGAPSGSARLYPERWLMLFLYSLNMATLSVLASSLPSSQLPAQHLYGVEAYPIVTLMSVLVFLCLPATIVSSWLFSSYGIRGTCTIALGISVVGAWIIAAAAYMRSWHLQVLGCTHTHTHTHTHNTTHTHVNIRSRAPSSWDSGLPCSPMHARDCQPSGSGSTSATSPRL